MESLEIARLLREAFPQEVLDIQEFRGQAAVLLRHGRILDVLVYAREHFDMFNRPITRQYPEEKPVVAAGFRGRHALVRDAATGESRCVACMRCARVCPSHCIRIRWSRAADNSRVVDAYNIDALRCIFCGYCAEVCPVNAIVLTEVYAYAANGRSAFKFDKQALLDNWDDFAAQKGDMQGYVNPLCRPRNMAFNAGTFTGYLAWGVGVLVAFMTAFYSFRLYFSVFMGQFRGTEHQREHLHESPRVVTVPLLVLAVGAVTSGWLGIPHGVQGSCRALPRVGA